MANEELKSCQACSATIYPEHITSGKAGLHAGKLLCTHCMTEKKSASSAGTASPPPKPAPPEDSLTLVGEGDLGKSHIIRAMGAATGFGETWDDSKFKRKMNTPGTGATRMRIFHTKMNDGASAFMVHQINEWLESHSEIEIKFVESAVGVWEGKHAEAHLILTVWY